MLHNLAHNAEAQHVIEVRIDEAAGAMERRARGKQEPFEQKIAEHRIPHVAVATAIAGTQGVEDELPDLGLRRGNPRAEHLEHPTTADQSPVLTPGQTHH
jgi:hypothetical protein